MRLLLFDIDGTLLLSGGAGSRALARAFREVCGIEGAMDGVSCAGMTDPLIVETVFTRRAPHLLGDPGVEERVIEAYLAVMAEELAASAGFRLMPHVRPCLEALAARSDVCLAVGTGNVHRGAALKLDRGGLARYFPVGGYGSDHRLRSGLLAAGRLRAEAHYRRSFPPESVWVVGDTPQDVAGAQGAGFVPVGVGAHAWDAASLRAAGALHAIEDLSGFCALLD